MDHPNTETQAGQASANGHRDVLVVEDDADMNQIVGAYVQMTGLGYRPAIDGQSALREARAKTPAVILLDLMLPDIDGFEVCRQLKNDPTTAAVPVVFLTALDQEESRRKGLACGAVEYLTKPFDPDRLMHAIRRHANHNGVN
jgi:two-component system phosphate regulon response regulator PhoB